LIHLQTGSARLTVLSILRQYRLRTKFRSTFSCGRTGARLGSRGCVETRASSRLNATQHPAARATSAPSTPQMRQPRCTCSTGRRITRRSWRRSGEDDGLCLVRPSSSLARGSSLLEREGARGQHELDWYLLRRKLRRSTRAAWARQGLTEAVAEAEHEGSLGATGTYFSFLVPAG
jgi:hypothetical protein